LETLYFNFDLRIYNEHTKSFMRLRMWWNCGPFEWGKHSLVSKICRNF